MCCPQAQEARKKEGADRGLIRRCRTDSPATILQLLPIGLQILPLSGPLIFGGIARARAPAAAHKLHSFLTDSLPLEEVSHAI
jgi:hypothetical protein